MITDVKFKKEHTGDMSMLVQSDGPRTEEETVFINSFSWIAGAFGFVLPVGECTPAHFIRRIEGMFDVENGDPRIGLAVTQLKTLPSKEKND